MNQTFSLHILPDARNIILNTSENPSTNKAITIHGLKEPAIVSFVTNERMREALERIDHTNEIYTERVQIKEYVEEVYVYIVLTPLKDMFIFSQQDATNFYYIRNDNVLCKIIEGINCKIDTCENPFDDESLDDLISRLLEN